MSPPPVSRGVFLRPHAALSQLYHCDDRPSSHSLASLSISTYETRTPSLVSSDSTPSKLCEAVKTPTFDSFSVFQSLQRDPMLLPFILQPSTTAFTDGAGMTNFGPCQYAKPTDAMASCLQVVDELLVLPSSAKTLLPHAPMEGFGPAELHQTNDQASVSHRGSYEWPVTCHRIRSYKLSSANNVIASSKDS
ncbi:unnamed protein product [Protopolystoma xenopodis]|uniref:Uncharacterized protein n=1 Tax=Protopolystoma xenopodis TaxID=117903 RepID=A0A3S5BSB3_9PLAT|nr:unnamed protein product [Protopolystoma xenopodis]